MHKKKKGNTSINKKIKNANTRIYKGIHFKSDLELSAYKLFEKNGIQAKYECNTYTIFDKFKPNAIFFQGNKKGSVKVVKQNNRTVLSTTYTPDFEFQWNKYHVIVEMKGYENDVFPLKFKMFRKLIESYSDDIIIAEIFSIGQLEIFIETLKKTF